MEINKKKYNQICKIEDKSIYISGKISGLSMEEAKGNFDTKYKHLKTQYKTVISPFKIYPFLFLFFAKYKLTRKLRLHHFVEKWLFFMIADLIQLKKCDVIYMMKNYKSSKGARIELFFAKLWRKEIIFESIYN